MQRYSGESDKSKNAGKHHLVIHVSVYSRVASVSVGLCGVGSAVRRRPRLEEVIEVLGRLGVDVLKRLLVKVLAVPLVPGGQPPAESVEDQEPTKYGERVKSRFCGLGAGRTYGLLSTVRPPLR